MHKITPMKKIYAFFGLILTLTACSDFEEQTFTVLLPDAGEDQVLFTEESGNIITLNGNGSRDINNLGFDYLWEIIDSPEGSQGVISNSSIASPTLEVPADASGRYELRLSISIDDQIAQDFVNIDINPQNAQILFVNGIDTDQLATLMVPDVNLIGSPVAARNAEDTYHNIDTNIATLEDGSTLIEVSFNGAVISTNDTLDALKSYTIYLVGTEENPEIAIIEKTRNQNTIGLGLVGLDFVNLSQGADNAALFIDATPFNFGIVPLDALFGALGVPEQFGALNYLDNTELFFPSNNVNPLPIWATVNGVRISNNVTIGLPPIQGNFGTFILFPDASSENGNTLVFLNNTELLPL